MGDQAWRNALDQHDAVASALVKQFRGDLTGGSDMAFASRGEYELKGLSEHFELFCPAAHGSNEK